MTDPWTILDLHPEADDAAIRARYVELVRRYPPEQAPEQFALIRAAYEVLRDRDRRLQYRLFESGQNDTLDTVIEEMACRTPRRRPTLAELLAAANGR
jgi:curved DNA-binding protein CbpA